MSILDELEAAFNPPTTVNYPLFKHLLDNHELVLTETELNDIIDVVIKIIYESRKTARGQEESE